MAGEHGYAATGIMYRATLLEVIGWIDKAWASVTTETILSGFRKAGISGTATDDKSDKSNTEQEVAPHLPPELAELLRSDTEDVEFNGFTDME